MTPLPLPEIGDRYVDQHDQQVTVAAVGISQVLVEHETSCEWVPLTLFHARYLLAEPQAGDRWVTVAGAGVTVARVHPGRRPRVKVIHDAGGFTEMPLSLFRDLYVRTHTVQELAYGLVAA